MRAWLYIALAAVLAAGAVVPAPAAAQTPLTYNLTVRGSTFLGTRPSGTIAGMLGGVIVDGTYAGGAWTLNAYGHPFATGIYSCVRICRFTGTTLAGRGVPYLWTSQVPTWDARAQLSTGMIDGVFASRHDWSTQVAAWARGNGLPPGLQTRLIVDAQTGM